MAGSEVVNIPIESSSGAVKLGEFGVEQDELWNPCIAEDQLAVARRPLTRSSFTISNLPATNRPRTASEPEPEWFFRRGSASM